MHTVRDYLREWQKTDVVQAGNPPVLVGVINSRRRMTYNLASNYFMHEHLSFNAIIFIIKLRHDIQ